MDAGSFAELGDYLPHTLSCLDGNRRPLLYENSRPSVAVQGVRIVQYPLYFSFKFLRTSANERRLLGGGLAERRKKDRTHYLETLAGDPG